MATVEDIKRKVEAARAAEERLATYCAECTERFVSDMQPVVEALKPLVGSGVDAAGRSIGWEFEPVMPETKPIYANTNGNERHHRLPATLKIGFLGKDGKVENATLMITRTHTQGLAPSTSLAVPKGPMLWEVESGLKEQIDSEVVRTLRVAGDRHDFAVGHTPCRVYMLPNDWIETMARYAERSVFHGVDPQASVAAGVSETLNERKAAAIMRAALAAAAASSGLSEGEVLKATMDSRRFTESYASDGLPEGVAREVKHPDGSFVRYDADGKIHCGNGPAVRDKDGNEFWFDHGRKAEDPLSAKATAASGAKKDEGVFSGLKGFFK